MLGHKYKGKFCGSYGDLSIFSFYSNKHITTGEGGAVLTSDPKYKNKIFDYKNLCFQKKTDLTITIWDGIIDIQIYKQRWELIKLRE